MLCEYPDAFGFAERIRNEVHGGRATVPLVGSGLSAQSGIPTAHAFSDYLLHCVFQSFLRNRIAPPWPEFPCPEDLLIARQWVAACARLVAAEAEHSEVAYVGLQPEVEHVLAQVERVLQRQALGALADWRATLMFLSRLHASPKNALALGAPNPRVIDSFNAHITRGARPNLGHQLLALLHRPLRIRTILTTNFDSLLEEAFLAVRWPLAVFDVHSSGGLPDHSLVSGQPSIVKLHGTRFETRADHSLDAEPDPRDARTFRGYFRRPPTESGHSVFASLLVLGFSASDHRIVQLVAQAAPLRVFWVCHSTPDLERLRSVAQRMGECEIHAVVCRADLLLFELYQVLTNALPPAGLLYEFAQYIPPHPTQSRRGDPPWRPEAEALCDKLRQGDMVIDGGDGVSSIAAVAYSILSQRGKHCLWLELSDYVNVDDLEATIFHSVNALLGRTHRDLVTLSASHIEQASKFHTRARLLKHLRIRPDEWILFLYGRGSVGCSAGFDSSRVDWLRGKTYRQLHLFLAENRAAIRKTGHGFRIVYMPLRRGRARKVIARLRCIGLRPASLRQIAVSFTSGVDLRIRRAVDVCPRRDPGSFNAILEDTRRWIAGAPPGERLAREAFVYGLTLCRYSAYVPMLSRALMLETRRESGWPNPEPACEVELSVRAWLNDLAGRGFVRTKPGGAYWVHRDLRQTARALIEDSRSGWASQRRWSEQRARLHGELADSAARSFSATGNLTPLMEWLHHGSACLAFADRAGLPEYAGRETRSHAPERGHNRGAERVATFRWAMKRAALVSLLRAVTRGRTVLLSSLEQPQGRALLDTLPALTPQGAEGDPTLAQLHRMFASEVSALRAAIGHTPDTGTHGYLVLPAAKTAHEAITLATLMAESETNAVGHLRALRRAGAAYQTCVKLYERLSHEELSEDLGELDAGLRAVIHAVFGKHFPLRTLLRSTGSLRALQAAVARLLRSASPSDPQLQLGVRALRRLAELNVKRVDLTYQMAELAALRNDGSGRLRTDGPWHLLAGQLGPGNVSVGQPSPWMPHALTARRLIEMARFVGRFVIDDVAHMRESFNAGAVEGVVLAYLGYFKEAHHQLDDAAAVLTNAPLAGQRIGSAVVALRRAMVCLLAAHAYSARAQQGATSPLRDHPAYGARLQDAWDCLDEAERLLAGETRAARWWERLYLLQLRVIAAARDVADSALAERVGRNLDAQCDFIAEKTRLLHPVSILRTLRMLWYWKVGGSQATPSRRQAREILREAIKSAGPYVRVSPEVWDFARRIGLLFDIDVDQI